MTTEMFLPDQEIERPTGSRMKSKQISWLRVQSIPFLFNGTGHPIVTRVAIEGPSAVPAATGSHPWVAGVLERRSPGAIAKRC